MWMQLANCDAEGGMEHRPEARRRGAHRDDRLNCRHQRADQRRGTFLNCQAPLPLCAVGAPPLWAQPVLFQSLQWP